MTPPSKNSGSDAPQMRAKKATFAKGARTMNTQTMPHAANLDTELETELEKEVSALNAPRLVPTPTPTLHPASDIERFLANGETLYKRQRNNIVEAEATYQRERFRLSAEYERRMQLVVNEAKDALRSLDMKHEKEQADRQRMMTALAQIRNG
jgi:transketolase